jgi:hypothetical protein
MDNATTVLFSIIIKEMTKSDPEFSSKIAKKLEKALTLKSIKETDKKILEKFLINLRDK